MLETIRSHPGLEPQACANESEIVCPSCGEADCWPDLDELIESDRDDFDLELNWDVIEDPV